MRAFRATAGRKAPPGGRARGPLNVLGVGGAVRMLGVGGAVAVLAVLGSGGCGETGSQVFSNEGGTVEAGKDGGALKACAKDGLLCGASDWCSFDPPGTCTANGEGLCKPRPSECPTTCPGVCGCNGAIYCNACEASRAGTDVAGDTGCFPTGGVYAAYDLFTNVPRIVVFKADEKRDVCVRVTLVQSDLGSGGKYRIVMPLGWAIERAQVTDHASDCSITTGGAPPTPVGTVLEAAGAQGKLEFLGDAGGDPCGLFIHASLAFDAGGFNGSPTTELLDTDNLKVAGACP